MNIGFIGFGKITQSIVKGLLLKNVFKSKQIYATAHPKDAHCFDYIKSLGLLKAADNVDLLKKCKLIMIAVKPQVVPIVVNEISPHISAQHLFISVASGITLNTLQTSLPDARIVRIMLNTPVQLGQGVTLYTLGSKCQEAERKQILSLFTALGLCQEIPENLMDLATAMIGCGPAYCYLIMEALVEAGIQQGLDRQMATQLMAQTFRGATSMILETKSSPTDLKHDVCSPGGATINALYHLEKERLRYSLMKAVHVATLHCSQQIKQ